MKKHFTFSTFVWNRHATPLNCIQSILIDEIMQSLLNLLLGVYGFIPANRLPSPRLAKSGHMGG